MVAAKILPTKKRPAWPRVKQVLNKNGTTAWMVDARVNGSGARPQFSTRVEADNEAERLRIQRKNEGNAAFTMSANDRTDSEAALRLLRPHDVSMLEAARFYLKHARFIRLDLLLADVIREYLAELTRSGASPYNVKGQRAFLARIERFFPHAKLADVNTSMLENWSRKGTDSAVTPITRNAYRRDLRRFFNFAIRREYLLENPAVKMLVIKEIETRCGILSVGQSARLLAASDDDFVPSVALGLFAGLRPVSEILPLDWASIDFNSRLISIEAARTKTARHRYVKMTDNLVEWLLPHKRARGPVAPLGTGPCATDGGQPKVTIYLRRLTKARLKGNITEWPLDVMRHTYGSMHLAHFRDAADTSLEMGHRTSHMLFRHYRARVTPEEAAAFWELRPGRMSNVVPMLSTAAR